MAIITENLRYEYKRNRPVLDGLSFCAQSGRITYLAGKNGCGKTTWVKTACGLLSGGKRSGRVLLDDSPFSQARSKISVVFDTPPVYKHLSVSDNLFVLYGQDGREPRTQDMLRRMGLPCELLKKRAAELSLGQRHRFGIAAALLKDADCFILDEPELGLDTDGLRELANELTLLREQGKTVLLTGQNYGFIQGLADDVVLLKQGKSAFQGPLTQFIGSYGQNGGAPSLQEAFAAAVAEEDAHA